VKSVVKKRLRPGMTLLELVLAATIGIIISLILGMLLYAGHKNWAKTFTMSNQGIEVDALQSMITFGATGRKSNKMDYCVYNVAGGQFTRSVPLSSPGAGEVVTGQAVEFRYWDTELNPSLMDTSKTATAYALFYLDGENLMMDRGPYDWAAGVGGVVGNQRNPAGTAQLLAGHVNKIEFSHTAKNDAGDGDGSVRMDITFSDPNNNRAITVKTTTLMRNVWGI
jgi:hypothetical protein